jgi:hypothetical protein
VDEKICKILDAKYGRYWMQKYQPVDHKLLEEQHKFGTSNTAT